MFDMGRDSITACAVSVETVAPLQTAKCEQIKWR